jgi:hypothetical protein
MKQSTMVATAIVACLIGPLFVTLLFVAFVPYVLVPGACMGMAAATWVAANVVITLIMVTAIAVGLWVLAWLGGMVAMAYFTGCCLLRIWHCAVGIKNWWTGDNGIKWRDNLVGPVLTYRPVPAVHPLHASGPHSHSCMPQLASPLPSTHLQAALHVLEPTHCCPCQYVLECCA